MSRPLSLEQPRLQGVLAEGAASSGGWSFDISKREAVKATLKHVGPQFGAKDVRGVLEKDYPDYSKQIMDNQLSAILSNFASRKLIAVHKKKSGQSPAIYENKPGQS